MRNNSTTRTDYEVKPPQGHGLAWTTLVLTGIFGGFFGSFCYFLITLQQNAFEKD